MQFYLLKIVEGMKNGNTLADDLRAVAQRNERDVEGKINLNCGTVPELQGIYETLIELDTFFL